MKEIVAAQLESAGTCNMNCKYCFIPKNESMKKIHNDILESIKSKEYVKLLKSFYGENLEYISLWGTEPTMLLNDFVLNIADLVAEFPKLKEFSFSTNMLENHMSIVEFANELKKYGKIKLKIQISLDGPASITDKNRHKNATNKIVNNFKDVYSRIGNYNNLEITFKPTITADNLQNDFDTTKKIKEWYEFFDNLVYKNVYAPLPTFEIPGNYTSQDGKNAFKFFKTISTLEQQNKENKFLKNYARLNGYVCKFQKLINFNRELQYKYRMFTCSGGNSQVGIDHTGHVHICHHTFFYNNEEYFKNAYNSSLRKRSFKNTSFKIGDDFERTKVLYHNRSYHDFMTFRINAVVAMMKEMMLCGQIINQDDDMCYITALFLNTTLSCPAENVMHTGSINIPPISLIRLFSNGCMHEIVKNA